LSNPYHAPASDLSPHYTSDDAYEPQLLALHGRIGRVRYIAFAISFLIAILFGLRMFFGMVSALLLRFSFALTIGVGLLPYLLVTVLGFVYARRRLNDMNRSGWWSILYLVPVVGLGLLLWLLCAPGDDGPNDYGPPPTAHAGGTVAAALAGPVMLIALAAIGVFGYQKYQHMMNTKGTVQAPVARQAD